MRAEWAASAPVPHCRQNSVDREQGEQPEVIHADTNNDRALTHYQTTEPSKWEENMEMEEPE